MFTKPKSIKTTTEKRPPMNRAEISLWAIISALLFIKCLIFQFGTSLNVRPFFSSANINMYLSNLSMLLAAGGLIYLLFNKHRFKALFIFYILVTGIIFADTVYFRYWDRVIPISVITNISFDGVKGVNDSIRTLFQWQDIIYFVDIPLVVYMYKHINGRLFPIIRKKTIYSVACILLSVVLFSITLYRSEITAYAYNENFVTKDLGVLFSHIDSTLEYTRTQVAEDAELTNEEINEIGEFYDGLTRNNGPDTGIASDMNIIVIMAESIQGFLIDIKINGVEVTPNLNRLAREGLYFNNIYYQTGDGNTSDAEFLQYTSLYPMPTGSVFHEHTDKYYPSFPMVLNDAGYDTYALHAFDVDYWNRHDMYDCLGFDKFIDYTYYDKDEMVGWMGNSLSDESFFRQSLDYINTDNQFYASFVTLSHHYPYSFFTDFPFDTGEYEGTFISDYLKGAHYADQAIGKFINDLKDRDLYDNSLLVAFGDHSGVPRFQSEDLIEILGIDDSNYEWAKLQKVPLIVHHPELGSQTISKVAGQIDIMPTIANLTGHEVPYALGHDILSDWDGYALLRNGSLITDDYIYLNDTREIFRADTGEPLNVDHYKDEINRYSHVMHISDLIVNGDGIRKLNRSRGESD